MHGLVGLEWFGICSVFTFSPNDRNDIIAFPCNSRASTKRSFISTASSYETHAICYGAAVTQSQRFSLYVSIFIVSIYTRLRVMEFLCRASVRLHFDRCCVCTSWTCACCCNNRQIVSNKCNDHGSGYLWRDLTLVYPYTTFHLFVDEDFIRLTFQVIITNSRKFHAFDFT